MTDSDVNKKVDILNGVIQDLKGRKAEIQFRVSNHGREYEPFEGRQRCRNQLVYPPKV